MSKLVPLRMLPNAGRGGHEADARSALRARKVAPETQAAKAKFQVLPIAGASIRWEGGDRLLTYSGASELQQHFRTNRMPFVVVFHKGRQKVYLLGEYLPEYVRESDVLNEWARPLPAYAEWKRRNASR